MIARSDRVPSSIAAPVPGVREQDT
jgi:hypothetical protein